PLLLQPMTAATSDSLELWLKESVCPVAQTLFGSRRFRDYVTWSANHLGTGSKKPQRRLVTAVDHALVAAATVATEVAQRARSRKSAAKGNQVDQEAALDSVVAWISGRPWFDLVSPEDFFTAQRGLHLVTTRPGAVYHREFWQQHEPRVPLGDYVCREMLA